MPKSITFVLMLAAVAGLVYFVPRQLAHRIELQRESDFRSTTQRAIPDGLPFCPPAGPQRDGFLRQAAPRYSSELWQPVCRIAPLPVHRVVMISTSRDEMQSCTQGSVWRGENVICALEEPLSFLADAKASITTARREAASVIWTTSGSMAWQDHLILEERRRVMAWLLLAVSLGLLSLGVRRTREAVLQRSACDETGDTLVPGEAEFVLLWFLGNRCRSLPGDLQEEYGDKLKSGVSPNEADNWYRWQVICSILPLAARRAESLLAAPFRRTRRG